MPHITWEPGEFVPGHNMPWVRQIKMTADSYDKWELFPIGDQSVNTQVVAVAAHAQCEADQNLIIEGRFGKTKIPLLYLSHLWPRMLTFPVPIRIVDSWQAVKFSVEHEAMVVLCGSFTKKRLVED